MLKRCAKLNISALSLSFVSHALLLRKSLARSQKCLICLSSLASLTAFCPSETGEQAKEEKVLSGCRSDAASRRQHCVSQRRTSARLSCQRVQPEDAQQVVSSSGAGDNTPKHTPSGDGAYLKNAQTASLKNTSLAYVHT